MQGCQALSSLSISYNFMTQLELIRIDPIFFSYFKLEGELGGTSGVDLDLMLDELGLVNLLGSNRRSDTGEPGLSLTPPSQYARGHSSPNSDNNIGIGTGNNEIAALSSR